MGNNIDWHGILISYIGVPAFLLLWAGYKWIKKTKVIGLTECDFEYQ